MKREEAVKIFRTYPDAKSLPAQSPKLKKTRKENRHSNIENHGIPKQENKPYTKQKSREEKRKSIPMYIATLIIILSLLHFHAIRKINKDTKRVVGEIG